MYTSMYVGFKGSLYTCRRQFDTFLAVNFFVLLLYCYINSDLGLFALVMFYFMMVFPLGVHIYISTPFAIFITGPTPFFLTYLLLAIIRATRDKYTY